MNAEILNERRYIDTNVFIYVFDAKANDKRKTALTIYRSLLQSQLGCTSLLVVSEWRNVMCKKYARVMPATTRKAFLRLVRVWNPAPITLDTILRAEKLIAKYSLSPFDSLHVQSALDQSCKHFLSEDMQDGLLVENQLRIVNPFAVHQ
jgi:predicted nucleic acid-binding protein